MKRGTLICFTGIDGSGKTTLSKYLVEEMSKQRIKTKYLWWLEAENSIFRKFLRFIGHRGKNREKQNYNGAKKIVKFPIIGAAYQYFVLLDYLRQTIFKVSLPLIFGEVIVCDRYIYDTIIAFSIEFDYSEEKFQRMLKIFGHLVPKPDILFLIDVPTNVALQRKKDIPSIEYLSKPKKMYAELTKQTDVEIIDGTKSLEELKEILQSKVMKYMTEEVI